MEAVWIQGGSPLSGEVSIHGSKNAALPILAACVLVPGVTVLKNCPEISDVSCMCEILKYAGAKVLRQEDALVIDASSICRCRLPEKYVTRMRSSVILAGAMLGRCREIHLHYPGGCVIGDRPIDLHIDALKRLGASFSEEGESFAVHTDGLKGADIRFSFPSVGATENALLAAVLAEGITQLYGCAREPEIAALCNFLNGAGARISGGGSSHITVEGVSRLSESEYRIEADRIVAGTYLIGILAAGGEGFLRQAPVGQLSSVAQVAQAMGAVITEEADGFGIRRQGTLLSPGEMETGVYPAFPTDLQSPLLVAMCQAAGEGRMRERIFNGRLAVTAQLNRMGAEIRTAGNSAVMEGNSQLTGCRVCAGELRGGAALVLAGLCAQGTTVVSNRQYIDRGYEDIVRDLSGLGAKIGSKTEI